MSGGEYRASGPFGFVCVIFEGPVVAVCENPGWSGWINGWTQQQNIDKKSHLILFSRCHFLKKASAVSSVYLDSVKWCSGMLQQFIVWVLVCACADVLTRANYKKLISATLWRSLKRSQTPQSVWVLPPERQLAENVNNIYSVELLTQINIQKLSHTLTTIATLTVNRLLDLSIEHTRIKLTTGYLQSASLYKLGNEYWVVTLIVTNTG